MPCHVALVTGASSGIGEATAQRLHGLGYLVYGLARRVDRMEGLNRMGVRTLAVDMTDESATSAAIEQIVTEQGRVDLLVNNAGYGSYGALEDVPLSEARYQFEVNVFGLARLIQLVLPHMRRQGSSLRRNSGLVPGAYPEAARPGPRVSGGALMLLRFAELVSALTTATIPSRPRRPRS